MWIDRLEAIGINHLCEQVHKWAVDKGFWETDRSDAECVALMHSELSEALESMRHNNPADSHCPEYSNTEIELADCVIRIMDYCGGKNIKLGNAIMAKMEYNQTRPYKHGKKF